MRCATMTGMRIDHVSYASEPDGMAATAQRLGHRLGIDPREGGVHPRFGTRNMILPLAQDRYVEVVEVLDHPASDKAPFGQAVRARSERGGGWMAWVVAVEDLHDMEQRVGRQAVQGSRHTPEGVELTWRQLGVKSMMSDAQLPYFVCWDDMSHHPSTLMDSPVRLTGLHLAGDPVAVREWLGLDRSPAAFEPDVEVAFDGSGEPALTSVTFSTEQGEVTL